MARVVVIGAGISGHTAAMNLKHKLGRKHEVVVISPNSNYQWVPSNIWVGTGHMKADQVKFALAPVYKKLGIDFKQSFARSIHPDGDATTDKGFVTVEYVNNQETEKVEYDYLINATGPKLNFDATEGLGPDKSGTLSICNYEHATHAWEELQKVIEKMKNGEKQKIVIGLGHGTATCQGAAVEYSLNVASLIKDLGLENMADIKYITNEYMVGDMGMGGAYVENNGYVAHTKDIVAAMFTEYGIKWYPQSSVYKVEPNKIYYETLQGEELTMDYDFSMLIPPFAGVGIKAIAKDGSDMTSDGRLLKPNGLMTVDADYTSGKKPYDEWSGEDWPKKLQNPTWKNIFAIGIAFAPPHPISKPHSTPKGRPLTPAPPRTGMPSAVMGHAVALNVAETIQNGKETFNHEASMAKFASICVVSIGYGFRGVAGSMSVYPTIPDFKKYPDFGRDIKYTVGEVGVAGHWFKWLMHYSFMYKAQGKLGWTLIPD